MIAISRHPFLASLLALTSVLHAGDPLIESFTAHLAAHPDGSAPFTFDATAYTPSADLSRLPIGVFDSGIGGLTVLEALLTADTYHNDTLQPGADGRPDFENERFIYLGDQANMPYGNYSAADRTDYLRELILKDAVFLLGQRYWPAPDAPLPLRDKPPVKAIVIACNTATAFGLDDLRQALLAWQIDVPVVGVVEAGARGLLSTAEIGSVGVLATVGTCSSGVYPRTIASTLGLAGRSVPAVTQYGSANLAAVIEGDAAYPQSVEDQVLTDVRSLVEAHRDSSTSPTPTPLQHIMLGCTHFPLVVKEIDAAFDQLRHQPDLAPWIAPSIDYLNPAEWTARELFRELAQARLRRKDPPASNSQYPSFFLSVPSPICSTTDLTDTGALTHEYKYGRTPGHFDLEDTRVIPMTRQLLPSSSRILVETKLPLVWQSLPDQ